MASKRNKKVRGAQALSMEEVNRIFKLRAEGKSKLAISRETGHHRATIDKYLTKDVEGYPQTPIDERVQKLRNSMAETVDFDVRQSLVGSLVLLDEYEKKVADAVAQDRIPSIVDAGEIKKIVDAKATVLRLPRDLGAAAGDAYDQIHERVAAAESEVQATDFTVIEERATESVVQEMES